MQNREIVLPGGQQYAKIQFDAQEKKSLISAQSEIGEILYSHPRLQFPYTHVKFSQISTWVNLSVCMYIFAKFILPDKQFEKFYIHTRMFESRTHM
jgi:hypothetical protein